MRTADFDTDMSEPAPGAEHAPAPAQRHCRAKRQRARGRHATETVPRQGGDAADRRHRHARRGLRAVPARARSQPAHDIFTRQSMLQPQHVEWSLTHLCDSSVSGRGNLSLCHLSCLRRMAHRAARVHDLQDWILGGRVRLNEGRPCVDRNRAFRYARLRHKAISALGPQPH